MARKKIDRQMMEPLSRTVLVKFGFLKDGAGFHLGAEKYRFDEDMNQYPESFLTAVQGDTPVNNSGNHKLQIDLPKSKFKLLWSLLNNLLAGNI